MKGRNAREAETSAQRRSGSDRRFSWLKPGGPGYEQSSMGLKLSSEHRMIAGVCGGIASWLGWSPTWVRILYVVGSAMSVAFPGILVYLVLWIVMPREQRMRA